ncbi:MAG: DUF1800 family protein [Pseudomonadota bacterium]
MTFGTNKKLMMTTALSAILTTTTLITFSTPARADLLLTLPNGATMVVPDDFDIASLGFPPGLNITLTAIPEVEAPRSNKVAPTASASTKAAPVASRPLYPVTSGASAPVSVDPDITPEAAAALANSASTTEMSVRPPPIASAATKAAPTSSVTYRPAPVVSSVEKEAPGLSGAIAGQPEQTPGMDPGAMPDDPTPPAPVDPDPIVILPPDEPVLPDIPTDIPTPDIPTFAGIGPSALAPPETFVLTQAVEITSGPVGDDQIIQSTGQTLFGAVMDPGSFDMVEVSVAPSGRTTTVDVSPMTGQFATRVFEDDFGSDGMVTVTLTGASSVSDEIQPESASYTMQRALPTDGFVQALSRVTYGATPQLYARVRAVGFDTYIEEQLNPDSINDSFFDSLRAGDLISMTSRNTYGMLDQMIEKSLAHASFSEKQLQEVMGAFWVNHFHAAEKDRSMSLQAVADREFFRENAFGTFEELLVYSARSPLMSRFLDNNDSRVGNLNENYGREILELHTVGVDGGYNDDDVIAVSRVFTGWGWEWTNPEESDTLPREHAFIFTESRHDTEDKEIPFLGITINGREGPEGMDEALELITVLSNDPRTQAFVCGKIVQKFVSDAPPSSFVSNCVAAWQASGGSTEAMLRAILLDPAFIETMSLQRNKAKTPFEFAASFVRAFDYLPSAARMEQFYQEVRESVQKAGFNPVRFPAPTGLPEVGAAWLNTHAIIEQYKELTRLANQADTYGSDLQALVLDAGLQTAEETAAYMLAIATADRYREEEYEAVVRELKGTDGFFEPVTEDETRAFRRAIAIIAASPSFHLQ